MTELSNIIEHMSKCLHEKGYKKTRLNYIKHQDGLTIIFAIQKSENANDQWYYNVGTAIDQLHNKPVTDISDCDIVQRLDRTLGGMPITAEILEKGIELWEKGWGNMESLRRKAIEDKLPLKTTIEVKRFLRLVRLK